MYNKRIQNVYLCSDNTRNAEFAPFVAYAAGNVHLELTPSWLEEG